MKKYSTTKKVVANRAIRASRICGSDSSYTVEKLLEIIKSWDTMIRRYRDSGNEYPTAVLSDLEASIGHVLKKAGVQASARSRKRPIKAAAFGHDPWSQIEYSKPDIIAEWQKDYTGEPATSWDEIFDAVLEDFKLYADDEASGNILDEFIEGDFDEIDMYNEFMNFVLFKDLTDYD